MDRTLASGAESVGSTPAEASNGKACENRSKSVKDTKMAQKAQNRVDQKLTKYMFGREQSHIHLFYFIVRQVIFDCLA